MAEILQFKPHTDAHAKDRLERDVEHFGALLNGVQEEAADAYLAIAQDYPHLASDDLNERLVEARNEYRRAFMALMESSR